MSNELKIIIAGGGTGGHIFPAIAIGQMIKHLYPNVALLFVGANGKMEMEKVPAAGFEIQGLDIIGFNRSNILKNILLPFKLINSIYKARSIIKKFKPDVVLGVGGYASFPILKAAQILNIPTVIQEQNSFAGKSNKILAKKATQVCVAYSGMELFFPKEKILITGNPIRQKIANNATSRTDAIKYFGLDESKKTILIIGGSLGALSINKAINKHLNEILVQNVQIIWQTGSMYYSVAKEQALEHEHEVKVYDFIKEMHMAYAAADIIISRSGAIAIAELCIVAKPIIFVPYPYAAEDHQTSNAIALVKKEAATMISNDQVNTHLLNELNKLLLDNDWQKRMSVNLQKLAIKDADKTIAQKIINIGLEHKKIKK